MRLTEESNIIRDVSLLLLAVALHNCCRSVSAMGSKPIAEEKIEVIMALYYDLPVFRDTYALMLKVFRLTKDFPREYKFTLGQDMKRDCIQLVRSIYRANKYHDKAVYLEHFLDDFEVLKLEVRLCKDLHIISIRHQTYLSSEMDSIGRQIVGWRNASRI